LLNKTGLIHGTKIKAGIITRLLLIPFK
jgi:hypothetical protein